MRPYELGRLHQLWTITKNVIRSKSILRKDIVLQVIRCGKLYSCLVKRLYYDTLSALPQILRTKLQVEASNKSYIQTYYLIDIKKEVDIITGEQNLTVTRTSNLFTIDLRICKIMFLVFRSANITTEKSQLIIGNITTANCLQNIYI